MIKAHYHLLYNTMLKEKDESQAHEFHIKTLTSELLYILILFFTVGIGFVVLMFLDEKYQYLTKFGTKLGALILKF